LCYDLIKTYHIALHKKDFITIYNYSKGAQGLSV